MSFTEAEQDVDGACLAVKVLLRPSTYKRFREIGEARGVEVGVLLSTLADRAVAQKPKRKPRVSLSPEQVAEAAHLRVLGRSYREIAGELGTSHTTVRKSLERQREAVA
ncbi:helix-turn-helix domain-containing protein [Microbacterium sp. KNMS]